jgi:ribosomal protein S18 acetylase RimI-like enzyme
MSLSGSTRWKQRAYEPSDKEACLHIFISNTPEYFLDNERQDFANYLEEHAEGYLVVESEMGNVVACGGYVIGLDGGAASLCWGMVHKDWQGKGLGGFLLSNRLSTLARIPQMKLIRMDTSQYSVEFFAKKGFKTYRITQNYYGPSLHRYEMYLILDDEKIREILSLSQ